MKEPVTKEQYEFYRALYDEEERTSLQLEGRAKVYLAIVSAFLAAMILKAPDAEATSRSLHIPWGLMLREALPMTITLALILWALRIRNFEAVNDRAEIISVYGDDWPTPEQFYEDRVGDYASASSINRALNNDTASLLSWGSLSMASPVLCCYDCRCLLVVILREAEDLLLPVAIAWFFYLDDAISWNLSNNYKKASFRPEQRGVIARRSGETPVFRSCRWPCSSLLSYPLQLLNSSLDEGNLSAHTRVLHTVFSPANNPHT